MSFSTRLGLILAHASNQDNRNEVERFAARLEVLPFDADASDHAADIRASLEPRGQAISGYDLLIACHARSRGLVVVTGNLGGSIASKDCDATIGWRDAPRGLDKARYPAMRGSTRSVNNRNDRPLMGAAIRYVMPISPANARI